jgi:hypothetical protein
MSKRTWYLAGLLLLAAACSSVMDPNADAYTPSNSTVRELAQQDTAISRPEPQRKFEP